MNTSSASGITGTWKRPLIGGLLSALVATSSVWIFYSLDPEGVYYILEMGFLTPAYIFTESAWISSIHYQLTPTLPLTFLLWFLIGAVIANKTKGNLKTIGYWFIVLILLTPLYLLVILFKNGSIVA